MRGKQPLQHSARINGCIIGVSSAKAGQVKVHRSVPDTMPSIKAVISIPPTEMATATSLTMYCPTLQQSSIRATQLGIAFTPQCPSAHIGSRDVLGRAMMWYQMCGQRHSALECLQVFCPSRNAAMQQGRPQRPHSLDDAVLP